MEIGFSAKTRVGGQSLIITINKNAVEALTLKEGEILFFKVSRIKSNNIGGDSNEGRN